VAELNLTDVINIDISQPMLLKILQVGGAFLIGWLIIAIIVKIERRMLKKSTLDDSVYVIVIRITKVVLWVLLVLTLLNYLGVSMGPFVTVLATAGAAIALALKDSLSNVAGGIILVFTKPFVKGDEVIIDGNDGVVDYIDILTTHLHTFDNKVIIVPNSKIVTTVVVNCSRMDVRRVDCQFGISYESDIDKAKDVIREVIRNGSLLLEEPEPVIGVSGQKTSQVVIDVLVWAKTEDRWSAKYYMEEEVKKAFDRNGISIPFDQMDVHIVDKPEGRVVR
jgi:small conductance mechanosensitive channel